MIVIPGAVTAGALRDGDRGRDLRVRLRARRHRLSLSGHATGEADLGVECHHRHEQARATELAIDGVWIVNAVAHIFAGLVLIGAGPDVGRRAAASGIAEPVVFLELGES